jgi:hypothetical protein
MCGTEKNISLQISNTMLILATEHCCLYKQNHYSGNLNFDN